MALYSGFRYRSVNLEECPMPACPEADIINGATPLENEWWGVHPRLYLNAASLALLKTRLDQPPWSQFLVRLLRCAKEGMLPHAALAWLLTGDRAHLEAALEKVEALAAGKKSGNWAEWHNLALAYDWLYHDLPEDLRARVRDTLDREGRAYYRKLALHEVYDAGTYGWNIALHSFLMAALPAFAVYGDAPDTAPWLRFVLEKTRVLTQALGPDGVSPEGICYGGFFTDSYVRVAALVRDLLAYDPFDGNAHMRNLPLFYLYSSLPQKSLKGGNVHMHFGDSIRWNWHGPDYFLRYLAGIYNDPVAQVAADRLAGEGVSVDDGTYFNLLWHNPAVPAALPADMPAAHHFADKGLVLLRSGWDGDESVLGFICGPHAGHHALKHYPQCIGGGHMSPAAGNLQIFARGDWLLNHGGYSRKFTAYHNTVLVNGKGQEGEGGDWFECRQLRIEKRGPSIRRFETGEGYAIVSADVAPAYPEALGLKRFDRHVIAVGKDAWVVVDDLAAAKPATFEVLFHAWEKEFQADRPFVAAGERVWETGGEKAKLRVTLVAPEASAGTAEEQFQQGMGAHKDRSMCTLRLGLPKPVRRARFVTLLEALPAGGAPQVKAGWDGKQLTLTGPDKTWRFSLSGGRMRLVGG
jgi:hypothetical protein